MTGTPPAFRWMGHASVLLAGPPAVVVDPWNWRHDDIHADVVLVTHAHVDHCSEEDLRAVCHPGTIAAGPAAAVPLLSEILGCSRVTTLREGDDLTGEALRVKALPMEGPRRRGRPCGFHPRGAGLAYLIDLAGMRFLHLGDSCVLPEHEGLGPDVAFVPAGGMVVMDPEEAAESSLRLGAGAVVPVHWGDLSGRYDVAARFVERCSALGVRALLESP